VGAESNAGLSHLHAPRCPSAVAFMDFAAWRLWLEPFADLR
jgi:hypothetical protein